MVVWGLALGFIVCLAFWGGGGGGWVGLFVCFSFEKDNTKIRHKCVTESQRTWQCQAGFLMYL